MKIRKATKKDINKVIKMWIREFAKTPWKEKWTKQKVEKTIKSSKGKVYVAIINNKIVGFIHVSERYYVAGLIVVLENLVVSKDYQNQGVGSELVEYIERIYRKKQFCKIFLNTMTKATSYKFYKKRGYKDSKYDANLEKKLK